MKRKIVFLFIFVLLAVGFLEAQYHIFHRANRYWRNNGIFSTDHRIQSIGANNALRLAYSGSYYTEIVANDEGELEIEKVMSRAGENESALVFDITWSGVDESRQGVINIYAERDTAQTAQAGDGLPGWGGSPEMGIKMTMRNTAEHGSTAIGHMRGMEIVASNRGIMSDVVCAYFSAESRSGKQSATIRPLWLIYDQSGNANTDHMGIFIQCNSQSSVGTNYGIYLTSTNYNQVREYGIFIDSNAGSWTNGVSFNGTITNTFDFQNTDGTNGAGFNASYSTTGSGAVDGYIKVDVGGNTLYIYLWPAIPS